ncbi:MAG: DUF6519 domain-containing protein [Acidobacteriota bacterium]
MKTHISRHSFRPARRYSSVRLQQGRMLYDADWNEQAEILLDRQDEALIDVIGSGAPRHRGVELVQDAPGEAVRLDISRGGWLYADGVGGQVVGTGESELIGLDEQLDFPLPEDTDLPTAEVRFYADVWQRTVVALEDPEGLLDAGLHGADTCTRTQTMAQVKWCPLDVDPEDSALNPRHGSGRLTLSLREVVEGQDPCDPCADEVAVEARVGNYLFRMEVHHVEGPAGAPTALELKWSSENGAEEQPLPEDGEVFPPGYITPDHLYELVSPASERHLGVHLDGGIVPERGRLEEVLPPISPQLRAQYSRVRRWDGTCRLEGPGDGTFTLVSGIDRGVEMTEASAPDADGHVDLSGDRLLANLRQLRVELELLRPEDDSSHAFVAGDHWLVAVREAAVDPDNPALPLAEDEPPVGIVHHYLRLGSLDAAETLVPLDPAEHHRLHFPRLTDLVTADEVVFQKPCDTSIFEGVPAEDVSTVADALGLLCDVRAEQISYGPQNPECTVLNGIDNVQDALDELCALASEPQSGGGGCRFSVGEGGDFETLREAVEELRPKGVICLCLLAGEHRVEGLSITRDDGELPVRVSIHGCGEASQVVLTGDGWRFERLQSVELESFGIRSPGGAELVTEDCDEVRWARLRFTAYRSEKTPLFIGGSSQVSLEGNHLEVLNPQIWDTTGELVDIGFLAAPELQDYFSAETLNPDALGSESPRRERLNKAAAFLASGSRDEQESRIKALLDRATTFFGRGAAFRGPLEALDAIVRQRPLELFEVQRELARLVQAFFFTRPQPLLAFESIRDSLTLRDNDLVGEVSFYGRADDVQNLDRGEMKDLRELFDGQDFPFIAPAASAHVEDNRCGRWRLGTPIVELLRAGMGTGGNELPGLFPALFFARNRTHADDSFLLAQAVRLSDNLFGAVGRRLASVLGGSSQYVGGHCEAFHDSAPVVLDVAGRSNDPLWPVLNHHNIEVP